MLAHSSGPLTQRAGTASATPTGYGRRQEPHRAPCVGHEGSPDTLALAEALLDDPEDLVRKATGWMLREVGKRAPDALEGFLQTHLDRLPRVTLRYAIERMPEPQRARYLAGAIPRP